MLQVHIFQFERLQALDKKYFKWINSFYPEVSLGHVNMCDLSQLLACFYKAIKWLII